PFAPVRSEDDLRAAVVEIGCPAILKTASFGYDGKGQLPVEKAADALGAWEALGRQEAILETFIDPDREISAAAAGGVDGAVSHFDPIKNAHRNHILDVSVAPAT